MNEHRCSHSIPFFPVLRQISYFFPKHPKSNLISMSFLFLYYFFAPKNVYFFSHHQEQYHLGYHCYDYGHHIKIILFWGHKNKFVACSHLRLVLLLGIIFSENRPRVPQQSVLLIFLFSGSSGNIFFCGWNFFFCWSSKKKKMISFPFFLCSTIITTERCNVIPEKRELWFKEKRKSMLLTCINDDKKDKKIVGENERSGTRRLLYCSMKASRKMIRWCDIMTCYFFQLARQ